MSFWHKHHGDAFRGRKVLVTGGAGFIGSHLAEALVSLGAHVVAVDDLSGGTWQNIEDFSSNVRAVTATILDQRAVDEAICDCEFVFHQAALASVPQSIAEPVRFYEVNVKGSLIIMESARRAGVKRVMFAGSSSAYGDPPGDPKPRREQETPLPLSPYASSKTACEQMLHAWSHSYGIDTAVFRYFNVFGPRQNANSAYAAVIAAFASTLLESRQPRIFGNGEQTRDFVFVRNVVHANLLAARCAQPLKGEVFNVGMGNAVTVNQLYAALAKAMNKSNLSPAHAPIRVGDVLHSTADIARATSILGYAPVVSFEDGLRETVDWYQAQHALAQNRSKLAGAAL